MNSSMYILLVLALIFANAPFLTRRWFGVINLQHKRFVHHLLELVAGFCLTAALAYVLESRSGSVYPQGWEFYVVVICLYLVFAFPCFVWRYFWHAKNND